MANKSFESRLNDYEVFCGAFIRNIMNNTGYSPAQVWHEHVKTKASTAKLESILAFMEICGLIKFTKEERLDKRTYKRSKIGKRDASIIAANLKTYFDLSSDNKDVIYELNEDGYIQRVKKDNRPSLLEDVEIVNPQIMEDDVLDGYNETTGEFDKLPEVYLVSKPSERDIFDGLSDDDLIEELLRRHPKAEGVYIKWRWYSK